MSIRLRRVEGKLVALCAARSVEQPGDVYLDDGQHQALAEKFMEDFGSEGYNTRALYPDEAALRAREESNNPARTWWDSVFGDAAPHGSSQAANAVAGSVEGSRTRKRGTT